MAKKGAACGNAIMGLPWILRVLLAIFLDCVLGICRFIDGILQGKILKIIIGFLWIFYGLAIGWILDIVFMVLGMRPLFL